MTKTNLFRLLFTPKRSSTDLISQLNLKDHKKNHLWHSKHNLNYFMGFVRSFARVWIRFEEAWAKKASLSLGVKLDHIEMSLDFS